MNLFVFAMLMLVLGDNLLVLFLGWEGEGLCSQSTPCQTVVVRLSTRPWSCEPS